MKRILIIEQWPDKYLGQPVYHVGGTPIPTKAMYEANLIIVKNGAYFDCIKNRWGKQPATNIPIELLIPYLTVFTENMSREELLGEIL